MVQTTLSTVYACVVYILQAAAKEAAETAGGESLAAKPAAPVTPPAAVGGSPAAAAAASPAAPGGSPYYVPLTGDPEKDKRIKNLSKVCGNPCSRSVQLGRNMYILILMKMAVFTNIILS